MKNCHHTLEVAASLAINLISSIAIIQINKYIYEIYEFPNMTLTCLNFLFTFFGLLVCNFLNFYRFVRVPIQKMLPMSFSFCGFVLLTNYSLEYNSIGTYQCLKTLTIPGVMIISIFFYKQHYSMKVKFSVVRFFPFFPVSIL
jgi:solute carrier family 35 protein E3